MPNARWRGTQLSNPGIALVTAAGSRETGKSLPLPQRVGWKHFLCADSNTRRKQKKNIKAMSPNVRRQALVTGATSGFGYEFCKLLAGDGYNLVMVARSDEQLHRVA